MSSLRVIGGSARGRRLRSVPGDTTRPITDRVKEALFNILGPDLPGSAWLDLFAGTGAVGIEALSRGADFVRFIDKHRLPVQTVQHNLATTGFTPRAEVRQQDAFQVLEQDSDRTFDYIYIAPPQYKEMWSRALTLVDRHSDWLVADGWVVVQIHPVELQPVALENLIEFDRRQYGSTVLIFYERIPNDQASG